ncbi:MAG TPA: YfiR family protein [Burkholderiales bacterium]
MSGRFGTSTRSAGYRFMVAVSVFGVAAVAHAEPGAEYQVKASYLYNFTQFIEWPRDVLRPGAPFRACVVGAARFGDALGALARERVGGRPIEITPLERPAQARGRGCHMLFIDASEREDEVPAARGLLTVGESPGFLERGGLINLVQVDGQIRFAISKRAAERAGLTVSAQLLQLSVNAGGDS